PTLFPYTTLFRSSSAETVVDVDDGNVGSAGIEHAEERRHAAETGAVADAGGNGNDWYGHEPRDDTGQGAFQSGHTNNHARLGQFLAVLEEAMNAGDANIVEMLGAVARHARGEERFLGHGNDAGPGRNY